MVMADSAKRNIIREVISEEELSIYNKLKSIANYIEELILMGFKEDKEEEKYRVKINSVISARVS